MNEKIQLREKDYKDVLASMEALGKTLKSDYTPPTDDDRTTQDRDKPANPVTEALRRRKEAQEGK
jgi:hypothetical protein